MVLKSFASKFFGAAFAAAAAAIIISLKAIVVQGKELVPIAMITHYTDNECSILDTSDFTGYYRNPNAEPGTAEAKYTYFCNPKNVPGYANFYGIHNLDSCFVDNGGK
mmetsp:Transcript_882/g.1258  ORF Transcript_882/g.1258 Transcript_882/m.1258 type:complete len:108 (-) Transcript_882:3445-3768(-)